MLGQYRIFKKTDQDIIFKENIMNVFIIAAPYQVLSAVEAVHHFDFKNSILIILNIGLFSKDSFDKIIDNKYWYSVKYIDFFYFITSHDFSKVKPKNYFERLIELYLVFDQFKKRRCIERLCRSIGYAENLFLGNYLIDYDLHMRHIANRVKFGNLFLLDVGTDTLRINKQRICENVMDLSLRNLEIKNGETIDLDNTKDSKKIGYQFLNYLSIQTLKKKIHSQFIEWNNRGVKRLTYFTCYSLKVNGEDRIINNNFEFSKSLIRKANCSQDIFFLGQPLIEQGYLAPAKFFEYVKKIKKYFAGLNLFYVPHPREAEEHIQIIQNNIGIRIKKFIAPIEHEIVASDNYPKCIGSFFSSALENFAKIFSNNIEILAFYLLPQHLLKDIEGVAKIYDNFKTDKNIKILLLK